jgi:hypothetical protein
VDDIAPTYPEAAQNLLNTCQDYRLRLLSLESLKRIVWGTALEVVDVEERATRDFLQAAEGKLDMLEHTIDEERLFDATLPVVSEIEEQMARYLAVNGATNRTATEVE